MNARRATVTDLSPRRRALPASRQVPAPIQGALALAPGAALDPPARTVAPGSSAGDWIAVPTEFRVMVEQWARRHLAGVVEVVAGDRPASQLVRWCTADVHRDLVRRAVLVSHAQGHAPGEAAPVGAIRPHLVSARVQVVAMDCFEASAHVRYGRKSRALAARFEWREGRWVNVALEFA